MSTFTEPVAMSDVENVVKSCRTFEDIASLFRRLFNITPPADPDAYKASGSEYGLKARGVKTRERINARCREILARVSSPDELSSEERAVLLQYSGRGGLTENSQYEYYTPTNVAQGVWDALRVNGFENGNVLIKPSGEDAFEKEEDFRASNSLAVGPHRSIDGEYYSGLEAAAAITAYQEEGLGREVPASYYRNYSILDGTNFNYIFDRYEFEKVRTKTLSSFDPSDMTLRSEAAEYENGIYVPENYILPLGDNRDNSRDGRYFGVVEESTINGRVVGRFWPLNRISSLTDNR